MEHTEEERLSKANATLASIIANSFLSDMPIENVKMHLADALNAHLQANDDGLYHIFTCTQDMVVYETWNSSAKYQRSFTITDNSASLGDDVVEVNLMTSIVPKANSAADEVNEDGSDAPAEEPINSSEGDETMSDDNNAVETPEAAVETPETAVQEPAANSAPAVPVTVEDYIAAAPVGMQDVLANSLKLHNAARSKLIEGIKANEANGFSNEQLDAMDMQMLEQLNALASAAKPPADYSGQAGGPRTNGAADTDQNSVPAVLEAFPREVKTA